MSDSNKVCVGDNQETSRTTRKYRSSLLITTTPVIDYANHSMQPLSLRDIFPYLSKRQIATNKAQSCNKNLKGVAK